MQTLTPAVGLQQMIIGMGTHIASGTDGLLKQPGFIVKTTGIGEAVRRPQTQQPAPTLARLQAQWFINTDHHQTAIVDQLGEIAGFHFG